MSKRIFVVDDDYAAELLVDSLNFRGHHTTRIRSAEEALKAIDEISRADLVVLDVIMEAPPSFARNSAISGGTLTGINLLNAFREKNPDLKILVYTGSTSTDAVDAVRRLPNTTFLSKASLYSRREVLENVDSILGIKVEKPRPRAFIVHGHDDKTKMELKNYLQNTLKFPEPMILHEQPNLGRTIIEKFEEHAAKADVVFVLLTPDDRVADPASPDDLKRRARQNVIFELGYFSGTLGRLSGRVFLLCRGPLELPSDIGGLIYIDISNGVSAAGEDIRRELEHVYRG